jgi:hypothetical protein
VVSVLQRISTGKMVLDYSAPVRQKLLLGGLRPAVGLVSGLVVHFALLAGLTTGQNGSTSVAFAATVGFVAGFSERLLVDMVERAGQLLTGRADGGPDPRAPATGGTEVDADIVAKVRDEEVGTSPADGDAAAGGGPAAGRVDGVSAASAPPLLKEHVSRSFRATGG